MEQGLGCVALARTAEVAAKMSPRLLSSEGLMGDEESFSERAHTAVGKRPLFPPMWTSHWSAHATAQTSNSRKRLSKS